MQQAAPAAIQNDRNPMTRLLLTCLLAAAAPAFGRTLDGFDDPSAWQVVASDQVSAQLRAVPGRDGGKALCLDYDFNGVSGHAGLQRELPLAYPDNYRFAFALRGDSPRNDLQFKLIDAGGDNVWWVNRPHYAFPRDWTEVAYKRRQIDKAWGPDPERTLRRSARVEFTIYNRVGGRGSVCFDDLRLEPLPAGDASPLVATASADPAAATAAAVTDDDPATAWAGRFDARHPPRLTLDLGKPREFGGLSLQWGGAGYASRYRVELSDDGRSWRRVREVGDGDGGSDWVALPESEARWLRLTLLGGPAPGFALRQARVEPLAFAATPNDFIASVAKASPRGRFPRGFSGEQPYWTIVGVDGGLDQGLIGEDGAIELAKGGFSIEPFVQVGGRTVDWAGVTSTQSLQDGYLPIPSVHWAHPDFALDVTAFAEGDAAHSRLWARYRLTNTGTAARDYVLALALRPWQVNPPTQFLNTPGGWSPIRHLALDAGGGTVDAGDGQNPARRVRLLQAPASVAAETFDPGENAARLAEGRVPPAAAAATAEDAQGLASGAWLYRITLAPGESREFGWTSALSGALPEWRKPFPGIALLRHQQEATAARWRDALDRVHFRVPAQGQPLVDTLRTATAHMLISRIGPRLQPGTRSYARSWIRDGAMISEGLLRLGRDDVVRDFVQWYAPYQFASGKVPCCVDARGSDPVPENDSHGELIFNIAEYARYTGDMPFLTSMWPHVRGAFSYMEVLRASERTEANRARNPAFYGMMPASISHEGYSAKPMHAYWDDFWALRGYDDAVAVASMLGKNEDEKVMAAARDQFRADLDASLHSAVTAHGLDYLPGSAELGDFDPTSTTIALAPGNAQGWLPAAQLDGTFQRYWREFEQRRDGQREWKDYTPYEWRNVAAFVRLGWRERAWQATAFFFRDRQPQGWNQWAEVVSRTPRTPFFVGDLPHAWVASDFVRSALDMFAYERGGDASLVLAAGIPSDWLDGEGIAVDGLRTPYGRLAYSLRRTDGVLRLEVSGAGLRPPPGGLVLPWPYADGVPGRTTIDGRPAAWHDGELRIPVPARVDIAVPQPAR